MHVTLHAHLLMVCAYIHLYCSGQGSIPTDTAHVQNRRLMQKYIATSKKNISLGSAHFQLLGSGPGEEATLIVGAFRPEEV